MLALVSLRGVGKGPLKNCDLTVGERARIGISGERGSGKSKLLNILGGAEEPDRGTVEIRPDLVLSTLAGDPAPDERTLLEISRESRPDLQSLEDELAECARTAGENAGENRTRRVQEALGRQAELLRRFRELGGPTFEGESRGWLGELGFTRAEMSRPLSDFDDGRRRFATLAALLARGPNLLTLDEPERDLAAAPGEMLERALRIFDGALVVASSDREFLHRATDMVFELRDGRLDLHDEQPEDPSGDGKGNVISLNRGNKNNRGKKRR